LGTQGHVKDARSNDGEAIQRTINAGRFPPNGYGLYDMAGNVWGRTSDWFVAERPAGGCCVPRNPRVTTPGDTLRYRPAARQGEAVDTSTAHLGFRCVVRGPAGPASASQPSASQPSASQPSASQPSGGQPGRGTKENP
jgi:formylglycine-generating enzyme required for sulfatase activity